MKAKQLTIHQRALESQVIEVERLARDEYRTGTRAAQDEFDRAWSHIDRLQRKGLVAESQAVAMFSIFQKAMNPDFDERDIDIDADQHPLVRKLRAEFRYVRLWHALGFPGKGKKQEAYVKIEA